MMYLEAVTKIDQIKVGDRILMCDSEKTYCDIVDEIKVTDYDGTEIIYDLENNYFFNLGMYLDGKSWVKEVCIVRF